MGAKKVITIDINPYMKDELLRESMRFVLEHTGEIENLFGTLLDRSRLTALLDFCKTDNFPIEAFLDLCNIDYIAPGDAANTNIPDGHIDFHTSYNVLEHIPPATLKEIIKEGNRLVRSSGLFIHKIDYSDHFSHSDKTISTVNFLQYSAAEWNRYAGNRFMYMNRLRHDDFIQLFESMGHKILFSCPESDPVALDLLEKGRLTLDRTYQSKPNSVLAIVGSWLVTQNTIKAGSYTNYDLTIQSTSDKTN
jgi:SAM-dependent methyltransferase